MNNPKTINGASSFFLDALRLASALVVLFHHAYDQWFPTGLSSSKEINSLGHASVVIFFVLSGFVITHTTISNNRGGLQYCQARLSRLCSIVIPALVITALAESFLKNVDQELSEVYTRGQSIPRYLLSGLFLNEIWFFSAAPPINSPLWSLSYEFWYYVIFGLFIYSPKNWKFIIFPLIACLVAGPKIMLMIPIWICGCVAYILPKISMHKYVAWLLVFAFLVVSILGVFYVRPLPYHVGATPFFYSNQFLSDWIIGLLVSLSLWLLPLNRNKVSEHKFIVFFRKIADLTFPIYVLHYPLLVVFRALIDYQLYNTSQMWQAFALVLLVCVMLGLVLNYQRFIWSRLFRSMLQSGKHFLLTRYSSLSQRVFRF